MRPRKTSMNRRALAALAVAGLALVAALPARASTRTIHVFVALCDNQYQGIVPVSEKLGNGDDPRDNLYWGALYGVKTHFKKSADWKLIATIKDPSDAVLERCVFRRGGVYLVADAYRGREIRRATVDFLKAAAGEYREVVEVGDGSVSIEVVIGGGAGMVAYIGHDGLMDFRLSRYPAGKDGAGRDCVILSCASKPYFTPAIKAAGANPLLWTTGLMAPEAYTLRAAVEGWINNETGEQVRLRAAREYHRYQKCGLAAAKRLFATGF